MGFETGTFTLSHFVPGCTRGERKGAGHGRVGGVTRKGADWLLRCSCMDTALYVHDTEQNIFLNILGVTWLSKGEG